MRETIVGRTSSRGESGLNVLYARCYYLENWAEAMGYVRDHELEGSKDEDVDVLEYDRALATRLTEVPQIARDERERHKPKPYNLKMMSSRKQQ
jgi:hypothetical protein